MVEAAYRHLVTMALTSSVHEGEGVVMAAALVRLLRSLSKNLLMYMKTHRYPMTSCRFPLRAVRLKRLPRRSFRQLKERLCF